MQYVSPKIAAKHFGVTRQTLRAWARNGKLDSIRTEGGQYRYSICKNDKPNKKFIYARVSSQKQKHDLERQIKFLKEKHPEHTVIKDIGSGINFKRKGLQTILDQVFKKNCKEVVVYSKDRLSRFANELLEHVFKQFGTRLVYVNKKTVKSDSEELAEDLMAVITVFSARYHGKRRYGKDDKESKILS